MQCTGYRGPLRVDGRIWGAFLIIMITLMSRNDTSPAATSTNAKPRKQSASGID
jgi:hypothetical protein